jgi:TPR repeat protein
LEAEDNSALTQLDKCGWTPEDLVMRFRSLKPSLGDAAVGLIAAVVFLFPTWAFSSNGTTAAPIAAIKVASNGPTKRALDVYPEEEQKVDEGLIDFRADRVQAERGHADAQARIARAYSVGVRVKQDYAEAARWYLKAAEQGEAIAQQELGLLYELGQGVEQNYSEAAKWYRLAAEQGVGRAEVSLGLLYLYGDGLSRDNAEAVKWFQRAANRGNPWGQYNLGNMYSRGRGVDRNIAVARVWWERAASGGSLWAAYRLGESHYAGEEFGVSSSEEIAKVWWLKAVELPDDSEVAGKRAAAGLQCLNEGKPSRECLPLRCSIEDRQQCPDL